ncbi:MAG: VTT domain-containing protein [Halohasta sp.]
MDRRRLALGGLTLAAVALAAWLVSPAVALAAFERLSTTPSAFAAVVLAVAVVRPLFAWPTLLLSIAVGYVYGIAGLPLAATALVVTALPPYRFGIAAGGGRLTATGERLLAETGGVRGVTAARLLPLPSDTVSVAAGAVGVRPRSFVGGTLLGELPWAIVGLLAGRSVDRLTAGELSGAVDPWLLAGMAAVGVALLAGPCYRLLSDRGSSDPVFAE